MRHANEGDCLNRTRSYGGGDDIDWDISITIVIVSNTGGRDKSPQMSCRFVYRHVSPSHEPFLSMHSE